LGESKEVPAVDRNLQDLTVFDHVADFRGRGLDQRFHLGDCDRLGKTLQTERDGEVDCLPYLEIDASKRLRHKTG